MNKQTTAAIGVALAVGAWVLWRRPVGTVTTSEGFDLEPYGGLTTYPEPIQRFARAIAHAEGFGIPGAIPTRAHNPGDLKIPNWPGPTLGEGISVFDSDGAGWNALYKQLQAILTGRSSYYYLDMSIAEMGAIWAGGDPGGSWARNVADFLTLDTGAAIVEGLT